jgi:hypothetical protein
MINRTLLPKTFSWYNPHLTPAEDLDLYFRLGKFGLFANLRITILMYRQHTDSETFRDPKHTFRVTSHVRRLAVEKHGYRPSLRSRLISLAQTIALSILPSSLIFPLYTLIRRTRIRETLENLRLHPAS